MPKIIPKYDTSMVDGCNALSDKWTNASNSEIGTFKHADIEHMNVYQVVQMLLRLVQSEKPIDQLKVKKLVEVYKLDKTNNAEIRVNWLRLGLRSHWKDCVQDAIAFVTSQGRMKFVRPIFRYETFPL
jgi:leukotriene-A4 hydrolase